MLFHFFLYVLSINIDFLVLLFVFFLQIACPLKLHFTTPFLFFLHPNFFLHKPFLILLQVFTGPAIAFAHNFFVVYLHLLPLQQFLLLQTFPFFYFIKSPTTSFFFFTYFFSFKSTFTRFSVTTKSSFTTFSFFFDHLQKLFLTFLQDSLNGDLQTPS